MANGGPNDSDETSPMRRTTPPRRTARTPHTEPLLHRPLTTHPSHTTHHRYRLTKTKENASPMKTKMNAHTYERTNERTNETICWQRTVSKERTAAHYRRQKEKGRGDHRLTHFPPTPKRQREVGEQSIGDENGAVRERAVNTKKRVCPNHRNDRHSEIAKEQNERINGGEIEKMISLHISDRLGVGAVPTKNGVNERGKKKHLKQNRKENATMRMRRVMT